MTTVTPVWNKKVISLEKPLNGNILKPVANTSSSKFEQSATKDRWIAIYRDKKANALVTRINQSKLDIPTLSREAATKGHNMLRQNSQGKG